MSKKYPGGIIRGTPVVPSGPFEYNTAPGIWTIDQATNFIRQGIWPTAGNFPRDPDFEYVTMLLHGDGTNGGQNNTFLDSSTNNFTITRNGNTTQGSFSPYGPNWSNFFVRSASSYITLSDSSAFSLGISDFTVECWIFPTLSGSTQDISGQADSSITTTSRSFLLQINGSGNIIAGVWSGSTGYTITSSSAVSFNTWNHIALVRSSGTLTLYVNGVSAGTSSVSTVSVNDSSNNLSIGRFGERNTAYYDGYVSNFRLVVGTAIYTANFTPSTTPLTAVSGTQLLTCQSNRFRDNSTNNFTVTAFGTSSAQRFSPFAPTSPGYTTATIGGSGYFDGSGDYLNSPSITLSGNFTIEGWVNQTSLAQNSPQISVGNDTSSSGTILLYLSTGGQLAWFINNSGGNGSTSVSPGTWNHVAMVRSGSTITMYLNGVSQGTDASSTTISGVVNIASTLYSSTRFFGAGYASNVRITTTAVYTGNFTPPTAPVTAITNTQLLLNFTNAAIFDNAMMNDLETVGNAQISTSVVKYGTGSLAFDGTGDWLLTPANGSSYRPSMSLKFTIEMWIYSTDPSITNQWLLCTTQGYQSTDNGFLIGLFDFGLGTGNRIAIAGYGLGAYWFGSSGAVVPTNQWVFVAVVGDGTNCNIYLNGTLTSSAAFPGGYTGPKFGGWIVGAGSVNGGSPIVPYTGYIDDLRITPGVARYTANFTPPTAAFPNN
jgi:hypothetical protein